MLLWVVKWMRQSVILARPYPSRPQPHRLCSIPGTFVPKPCEISAYRALHVAPFRRKLSPFRMNTSESVSKQTTLTPFRMNTYEKQGEGRYLSSYGSNGR